MKTLHEQISFFKIFQLLFSNLKLVRRGEVSVLKILGRSKVKREAWQREWGGQLWLQIFRVKVFIFK